MTEQEKHYGDQRDKKLDVTTGTFKADKHTAKLWLRQQLPVNALGEGFPHPFIHDDVINKILLDYTEKVREYYLECQHQLNLEQGRVNK